jgi:hypothetical protein
MTKTPTTAAPIFWAGILALAAAAACVAPPAGDPAATPPATTAQPTSEVQAAIFLPLKLRCADGSVEQIFPGGMIGCAGNVTWSNRASLCGPLYRVATDMEKKGLFGYGPYWTDDVPGDGTAGALCVPSAGCADGTAEQIFPNGMVGCAGAVTWANRDSLCAAGYRTATSQEYFTLRQVRWAFANGPIFVESASVKAIRPTHNYWTADNLRYDGTADHCFAGITPTSVNSCPSGQPMRVCTPTGSDPEGNVCNWFGCQHRLMDINGGETYMTGWLGGCFGNTTAGALCVPKKGCADGTAEDVFPGGMVGCAGSVSWANRDSLCAAGYRSATAAEFSQRADWMGLSSHDYWVADNLRYSGSSSSCDVSTTSGNLCTPGNPMRVCTPGGSDAEGNSCTWARCKIDDTFSGSSQSFGGCNANPTAGTVCLPRSPGCADASTEQDLPGGLAGCAGSLSWSNRAAGCAAGYRPASAREWMTLTLMDDQPLYPLHNYWTDDDLAVASQTSSGCVAGTAGTATCPDGQPMHLCVQGGTDPEGNQCQQTRCTLDAAFAPEGPYHESLFGGCSGPGNATAGVACLPTF